MPKGLNLKNFGRRKSSGNALDYDEPEAAAAAAPPSQSTFRVIERPDKKTTATYGAQRDLRFNSPLRALRGKSADDLGLQNRGSGGTTNSGSSGYYDSSSASARHSSTSTLPSSVEQDRDDELFAPVRKSHTASMYHSITPNNDSPPLPPPPSFTTRAARALSFGNRGNGKTSSRDIPPVPPPHAAANGAPLYPQRSQSPVRERAMTTSSYASTAVPTKADLHLSVDGLGTDDFGSMFDSLKKDNPPPPPPAAGSFNSESQPMFPPRTYSRSPNGMNFPQSRREENGSPAYSDRRDSNEGLMSNSSALSSPNTTDGNAPGPAVGNGIAQAFLGSSQSGYSRVPERYTSPGPERASIESYRSIMDDVPKSKSPEYASRQTQIDDEDRWVRRIELHDPPGSSSPSPVRAKPVQAQAQRQQLNTAYAAAGPSRAGAVSPKSSTGESSAHAESNNTTPRAARSELRSMPENSIFDSSPAGPPSAAIRPGAHQRTGSGGMKKMTKAQFQALQRRGESSEEQSEEEDLSGDEYDDEDDVDRAKKMATQRRKQEANMSVYRQQMKKVTGGGPTDLPSSSASTVRPSMDRGASASAASGLHFGGIGGTPPADTVRGKPSDDEDDDVPLGILQAHGFPTSSRPPTRMGENDLSHQRRTSVAGSVVGGGAGQGNLPPFARRLPADPYFGAGLVNQSTRESLAMNSNAGSVVGMPTGPQMQQQPPSMGHPGGLVGVIAGEERARAARRGSPNMATGSYNNPMGGPMPLPGNMSMQQPPMPRTMSMGNLAPPSVYGGAPPMPPMPQMMPQTQQQMQQSMLDPGQQQMQQFMQMQMQLMQNMLAMQQQQMGQGGPQTPIPQPPQQAGDYLGVNFGNNASRPMSMASNHSNLAPPPSNQGRAMTMMNPPPSWNQAPAGGPRPNSAMPTTGNSYAPSVSGLNVAGGPGPGYTPSIAPSERSNIGMPSRYRPVTQLGDTSRSQSMTSSMTLQAFANQQAPPNLGGTSYNGQQTQAPKSTIRVVDKPKGGPKTATPRASVDDEDDGWAEMRKKREDKKRSKWGKKSSTSNGHNEMSIKDLYQGLE